MENVIDETQEMLGDSVNKPVNIVDKVHMRQSSIDTSLNVDKMTIASNKHGNSVSTSLNADKMTHTSNSSSKFVDGGSIKIGQ